MIKTTMALHWCINGSEDRPERWVFQYAIVRASVPYWRGKIYTRSSSHFLILSIFFFLLGFLSFVRSFISIASSISKSDLVYKRYFTHILMRPPMMKRWDRYKHETNGEKQLVVQKFCFYSSMIIACYPKQLQAWLVSVIFLRSINLRNLIR